MRTRSDESLVADALADNSAAFGDLYDRYSDRIHTFAMSRLRDPADAADALQTTFITAHRRLSTLDDPAKFRPWLFAIARTTIIDVARDRDRRAAATLDAETTAEVTATQRAPGRDLEAEESGLLLWNAAASLQPRDQELLELHLREGLDGADLALAMNVEPAHVYVMVKRLKERLGTAVGSLLVARRGRKDCTDLNQLLGAWDGSYSLAIRSTVTRHIESCDTCGKTRKIVIGWESVASAMPAHPAPTGLRAATLASTGASVGSTLVSSSILTVVSVFVTTVTTVGALALPVTFVEKPTGQVDVAGEVEVNRTSTAAPTTTATTTAPTTTVAPTTVAPTATAPATTAVPTTVPRPTTTVVLGPAPTTAAPTTAAPTTTAPTTTHAPTTTLPPTTAPPIGPLLGLSAPSLDLGPVVPKTTLTVTNDGDQPLNWTASVPAGSPFTIVVDPADSPLAPSAAATIGISFARVDPVTGVRRPEGSYLDTLTLTSNAGAAVEVALAAAVEAPPIVQAKVNPGQIFLGSPNCVGNEEVTQATVSAVITDESPIKSAVVIWDQSTTPLIALVKDPTTWAATIGPWLKLPQVTPTEITIQVADDRGNTTTAVITLTISDCPQ